MKVVKKYTAGKRKGWNIRQGEDKFFYDYQGNTWQAGKFETVQQADLWLRQFMNLPSARGTEKVERWTK